MKILHTADWHLGDRLGMHERHDDLDRSLAQIAKLLDDRQVDVLLIAGDVFSDYCHASAERLKRAVQQINTHFGQFLSSGRTMVAVSGNHDSEDYFRILNETLSMVSQERAAEGCDSTGRPYFFADARKSPLRLKGRDGQIVQFVPMPYPSSRYLPPGEHYRNVAERNQAKHYRYLEALGVACRQLNKTQPAVLLTHLALENVPASHERCLKTNEEILFTPDKLSKAWTWNYIACGHIHKAWPPTKPGSQRGTVGYSGSIDCMDYGEADDEKGVVIFDLLMGKPCVPEWVKLDTTPFDHFDFEDFDNDFAAALKEITEENRAKAIVRYTLTYHSGKQNLNDLRQQIEQAFPRCYCKAPPLDLALKRHLPRGVDGGSVKDVVGTVKAYVESAIPKDDTDREALLLLAQKFMSKDNLPQPSKGIEEMSDPADVLPILSVTAMPTAQEVLS